MSGGDAIPSDLGQALSAASAQDGPTLRQNHPVELRDALDYDAKSAAGLALIQASKHALLPAQLEALGRNGFVERLRDIALRGPNGLASYAAMIDSWATNFIAASGYLEQMAQNQRSGTPHGPELLAFVNDAVRWDEHRGCAGDTYVSNLSGWYTRMLFAPDAALKFDPTIADVHTEPNAGQVLHVATGYARTMVVTVNTCAGPRAYAGLASSYAEKVTDGWMRLNDQQWATMIETGPFPDVPWMNRSFGQ